MPDLDFDLHGMVGVRLIGATSADRAAVAAQLGPIAGTLDREPDIVIRFVDRLRTSGRVRLLGIADAAFTDDAFLLLRGKHGAPVRVQIPFDRIGLGCELVCEHGLPAVPLLIAIINLTVLAKGGLAMHASAFRYAGTDVLVTGWSKGGKTELLLGFAAEGASYIGDEWIYTAGEGGEIFGVPEPIRVWDWHLQQLPGYRRRLAAAKRLRLRALGSLSSTLSLAGAGGGRHTLGRIRSVVDRQRYVHLEPRATFGDRFGPLRGTPRTVIFIASHASPETTVERADPGEIADRMVFSLQEERAPLMAEYRKYRFAFPSRSNPLLEGASELEHQRLRSFLEGLECHAVHHPYPPSIAELFDAVRPVVERRDAGATVAATPHDLLTI